MVEERRGEKSTAVGEWDGVVEGKRKCQFEGKFQERRSRGK